MEGRLAEQPPPGLLQVVLPKVAPVSKESGLGSALLAVLVFQSSKLKAAGIVRHLCEHIILGTCVPVDDRVSG